MVIRVHPNLQRARSTFGAIRATFWQLLHKALGIIGNCSSEKALSDDYKKLLVALRKR